MMHNSIALFAPHFEFSGTTGVIGTLAAELAGLGHDTQLLRAYREWPAPQAATANLTVVDLACTRAAGLVERPRSFRARMSLLALAAVPALVGYLRRHQPRAIILGLLTVPGLWAVKLAGVPTKSIVSIQGLPRPRRLHHPLIQRYSYLQADAIVADCVGVADALAEVSGIARARIDVVQNPVLDGSEAAKMREPVDHPWFHDGGSPLILAVGRLIRQKDFATLLRAFALVRAQRPARLLILGEGEDRAMLKALAAQLGIEDDLRMPGHVSNPFKYMAAADAFVLSSLWEGPGHVVIEALATGTPIVATDCPTGPSETLLGGQLGTLVPVGDPAAMARGILDTLEHHDETERKAAAGLQTLERFRSGNVAQEYVRIIDALYGAPAQGH
jgi:glycosyltransferase involved in cell wall biosynthesis